MCPLPPAEAEINSEKSEILHTSSLLYTCTHKKNDTKTQPLRVVVDTGSPLFGLFVSKEAVGKYTGTETGVAHRRPAPLQVPTREP